MPTWGTATDAALLRAAGTDPDAFAELYVRHEPVVAGFLHRRTRDPELTADLTAEAFATALLKSDRFGGDGPAVGWLLGIARHLHLHHLRSGRAEQRACVKLGVERVSLTDASIERVEQLIDERDPSNPMIVALAQLPEAQHEAVVAFVVGDRTYDELADDLGVAAATVRQRVSRGLSRLRTSIDGARP